MVSNTSYTPGTKSEERKQQQNNNDKKCVCGCIIHTDVYTDVYVSYVCVYDTGWQGSYLKKS